MTADEQLPHPVDVVPPLATRQSFRTVRRRAIERTMCENEKLIDLVRNCPILYDMKHKQYKDNARKADVWTDIAVKLRLENGIIAKNKWRHLRDSYAKHLRTQSSGQYKKYKHWSWASQMEFLKPHVTSRQTDVGLANSHSDSDTETRIKSEPPLEEKVQYREDLLDESMTPSLRKQESQQSIYSSAPDETFEYLQTGKLQRCMDEIDLLFLSYAQTLKTLSPRRQVKTKLQIAKIINNAELAQLQERNLHFSSTPSSSP